MKFFIFSNLSDSLILNSFAPLSIVLPSAWLAIKVKIGISSIMSDISFGSIVVATRSDLVYLSSSMVKAKYTIPLLELVSGFYDSLKSISQGFASLDYKILDFEKGNLVKLDILVNGEIVDSFSSILSKENSELIGRKRVKKLSELIPRQQFDIPIQAAIGSRIIARETIKALRKDVTAKLYGGDVTRKRKLLEKQKEGKKKMRNIGKVEVPKEAFREFLKE